MAKQKVSPDAIKRRMGDLGVTEKMRWNSEYPMRYKEEQRKLEGQRTAQKHKALRRKTARGER